jgi:SAM-dependent methyltransferase
MRAARAEEIVYRSAEKKTEEQVQGYLQTHQAPHRFLAYRDIPTYIQQLVQGKRALDYGAGTGASSSFLYELGLEVTGIDVSLDMLKKARLNFPHIQFHEFEDLISVEHFDLVFSSFVLFEISSKEGIVKYLNQASSFLKKNGIFIGITGSECLYSLFRNWLTFNANFKENCKLHSGGIAKLELRHPKMEFHDFYWEKTDYLDCFKRSNLEILEVYHPLGFLDDPYQWKDELVYSPFTVFFARNSSAKIEMRKI